jgi:murein L,D-transpeptidase YcbB/YkuD
MIENDNILDFDFSSTRKLKNFFLSLGICVLLCASFFLFSSYHYPSNLIVDTIQFNNLIKLQTSSLLKLTIEDTTENINDQVNDLLVKFYANRNYKLAWIENYQTNKQFDAYINILDSAKYFGFPFDYFSYDKIKSLRTELNKIDTKNHLNTLIELELTATYSSLKFLIYLNQGIIEKDTSEFYRAYINTLPAYLSESINSGNFRNRITEVQPNVVEHEKLLKSLPYFIDLILSIKNTTPAFIDDQLLAKSLYYSGITKQVRFDSINTKSSALFELQNQHKLTKDPQLNDSTHKALVEQLQQRYYQACLNLHRLRRLNYSGGNYLFVNIPEFRLHVVEANKTKDVFNVIVGKKKTPTPTLSSSIEKVIANPFWTVPRSILTNEMVYKIRKDSTYLKRNGFFVINNFEETVDESSIDWNQNDPLGKKYWVRQINSRYNALGQVKFIFPNDYSVYLHDTPSKRLFKTENRTYSHGCIRLENPEKLAQYLSDTYNTVKNLNFKQLISKKQRQEIQLSEKINIHIQYITCSGDENNDMVFYNDIYDRDKEEIKVVFPTQTEKSGSM